MALFYIFVISSVCSAQECDSTAEVIWQPTSVSLNLNNVYEITVFDVVGSASTKLEDPNQDGWIINSTVYPTEKELYAAFWGGKISYSTMVSHLKPNFTIIGRRIKFAAKTTNQYLPFLDWYNTINPSGFSSTKAVEFVCNYAKINTNFMRRVSGQEGTYIMRSWLTNAETVYSVIYIPNSQVSVYNIFVSDFAANSNGFTLYKTYTGIRGDVTKVYKRL